MARDSFKSSHHISNCSLPESWSDSVSYLYHIQSFEGDLFLGLAENQVFMLRFWLLPSRLPNFLIFKDSFLSSTSASCSFFHLVLSNIFFPSLIFLQNVVDLEHTIILFQLHDEGRMLYGIFIAQVAHNDARFLGVPLLNVK